MRTSRFQTNPPVSPVYRHGPDMSAIVGAAIRTDGRSSEDRLRDLEQHAGHEFTVKNQGHLARLVVTISDRAKELDRLDGIIARLEERALGTDERRPARGDALPWTWFNRFQVVAYSVLSLAMQAAAWNLTTATLLNTGLFHTRWEAGTLTLIPLLGAVVLKCGAMLMRSDSGKRNYLRALFVAAVLFWAAWITMYTAAFGHGVAESADDVIDQLLATPSGVQGESGSDKAIDVGQLFLAVSFLAEAFISALIWLVIEQIVSLHAGATSVANPERVLLDRAVADARAERRSLGDQQYNDVAEHSTLKSQHALHANATLAEFQRLASIAPEYIRAIATGGESVSRPSQPAHMNGVRP